MRVLGAADVSDGSWDWSIPADETEASDYKIRVKSKSIASLFDDSDTRFVIGTPSLDVTTPNGGENWPRASAQTIAWSGVVSGKIRIFLHNSGGKVRRLKKQVPSSLGQWTWNIPGGEPLGTDYRIRVKPISDPSLSDFSDGLFEISAAAK